MQGKGYVKLLKSKFENLLQLGIKQQDTEIEKYAIYFTNAIALQSAIISSIYFIIYLFKYTNSICLIYVTIFLLSLVCLFLNAYGFRKLASLYILGLNFAIIIFTSFLGGFSMEIHPLLIVLTLCSASILLSFRLALVYNIVSFILYVMARNYSTEVGPWLSTPIMPNRHFVNFGFVFVSAFVVSRIIFSNVRKYVNNQKKALDNARGYIEKIEKQNKRLEMFNSIAEHDLRTPTRQVISFSGMAKKLNASNNDHATRKEYLEIISKAGYRMSELIDSISILNSVSQKENQEITPIDLSSIVSQIESEIVIEYENANVLYSNLPVIKFRQTHLKLVFENLMKNAVKFNNNNEKFIQISSKTDSNNIFIYVEDNGIGIEEEFKDLIFEPFKKLHVHEAYDGSGLGLYIVSDILNYYEGNISYSKNNPSGSIFTITLPIKLLCKNNVTKVQKETLITA